MSNLKIKYVGFLSIFLMAILGCGHAQTQLADSKNAPPLTNDSVLENSGSDNVTSVAKVVVNEFDAEKGRSSAKNFVSPLTKIWQTTFQNELGLTSKEVSQLYQSSALDRVLRLSKEEQMDWIDFFPPLKLSRWFYTKCRYCERLKALSLGRFKFLTGDVSDPVDEGKGSRPAVAFDPSQRNYLIVWDEQTTNGGSDVYAKLVAEDGVTVRVARKLMSVARPTQGCLFSNFASSTGLSVSTDCKENVEPSVAYNNGRFLITWTKRGKAVHPENETFSVIIGMLMNAVTLEPASDSWKEGILLSKITYASADPSRPAETDAEVQAFSENEHSHVAPFFGTGGAQGTFLLVWDTTKDFITCNDVVRRTTTSIYGRVIPANFNPAGGNRDIFPVYTDPSSAQTECAPNSDVNSARKPRLATLSSANAAKQYVVVFETSKNLPTALSSIGGVALSLANDFTQTVSDIYNFEPLDSQLHEGCTNPDIVAAADRFLLVDEIKHERLNLTDVTLNRNNIVVGAHREYEAANNLGIQRPRVVANRVVGQEGGNQTYALEYVVAYEAHPTSALSTASNIQLVGFSQSLEEIAPRVTMPNREYPTHLNPALASSGMKVLAAWNGLRNVGQNNEENRILDSLVTVNIPAVPNQKPTAVITVTGHEENPVTVMAGESIVLSGAESSDPEDGNSDHLSSYRWQQTGGPLVQLQNATQVEAHFTASTVQTATNLTFQLVVKDQHNLASDAVLVTIRVLPPVPQLNPPRVKISRVGAGGGAPITELTVDESPQADPVYDPDTGLPTWSRTRITLSGSLSDNGETPPGPVASYQWMQVTDDGVTIEDASGENSSEFSFTVPEVLRSRGSVVLTIRLAVDDRGANNNTASQDLRITVRDLNHRPTAPVSSGPENGSVFPPSRVLLTWENSQDPDTATDGDPLTYDVYFGTQNPPTSVFSRCTDLTTTHCVVDGLAPTANYYWQVKVKDVANENIPSSFSAIKDWVTDNSVLARWNFDDGPNGLCEGQDENLRGRTACDQSGNGWHATHTAFWLQNGDSFLDQSVNNILGRALGFSDNHFAQSRFVVSGTQSSLEFWLYPIQQQAGAQHSILYGEDSDTNDLLRVQIKYDGSSGMIHFTLNTSSDPNDNFTVTSAQPLRLNQWNHLVCIFGPNGTRIFVNGALASPIETRTPVFGNYRGFVTIGGYSTAGFFGVIDEVVVYNQDLSQEVINNLANSH